MCSEDCQTAMRALMTNIISVARAALPEVTFPAAATASYPSSSVGCSARSPRATLTANPCCSACMPLCRWPCALTAALLRRRCAVCGINYAGMMDAIIPSGTSVTALVSSLSDPLGAPYFNLLKRVVTYMFGREMLCATAEPGLRPIARFAAWPPWRRGSDLTRVARCVLCRARARVCLRVCVWEQLWRPMPSSTGRWPND